MISKVYNHALDILKSKPIKLWGLSLLAILLSALAQIFAVLPIISIPISVTIYAGMLLVFLDGYKGKEVDSNQLFAGFKSFSHIAGGMLWMMLWILIWALIPIVGFVFAIIKSYEYRFTPYILFTQPKVSVFDALKLSMKQTEGYKGTMFGADMIIVGIVLAVELVLYILGLIPYIGAVLGLLIALPFFIVLPLFQGLVHAGMYIEITENKKD